MAEYADAAPKRWRTDAPIALLWALAVVITLVAVSFARRYTLREHGETLTDIGKLSGFSHDAFWHWVICGVLMTACSVLGGLLARRAGRRASWPILAGCIGAGIGFSLTYPATAIDVFIYAARSRLFTEHGLNPLDARPNDYLGIDPYMQYASQEWGSRTSPYGPLWNLLAAPATLIGGASITTALFVFKGIAVAAWLGCGALIWRTVERLRPGDGLAAACFFLWNPIVLWEGIANGHNDLIMILFVLAAAWAYVAKVDEAVVPLIVIAVLIKYAAIVVLPIAAIAVLRRQSSRFAGVRLTGLWALWSLGLTVVSLAPFYDLEAIRNSIDDQTGLLLTSPGALLHDELRTAGYSADIYNTILDGSRWVAIAGIGLLIALTVWKPWKNLRFQHEAFWILILAGTPALRPWYAIWMVAMAMLLPIGWPTVRAVAYAIGAYGLYAISIWIWNWTGGAWIIMMRAMVWTMLGPALLFTIVEAIAAVTRWDRGRRRRIPTGFGSQWSDGFLSVLRPMADPEGTGLHDEAPLGLQPTPGASRHAAER
jgi:hypothetical protein